ncbi:MAG: TrbC/VirB2 family protein [Treponema sp.]|nr:TrbC/VirB2 family protein [Treponema sp.]
MKKIFGWCSKHKTAVMFFLTAIVAAASTFAADTGTANAMNERVGTVIDIFNNNWVKGIAALALIGECLGLLFAGGQNPQIFKKMLPVIAGTVLFMCAGKITTLLFGDFGQGSETFSEDLKLGTSMIDTTLESLWT